MFRAGLRVETAEVIGQEIGFEALTRLGLDTVTESPEEIRLLGGAAIFLRVVSSDLVIKKEEVTGFDTRMVAAARVIDRLGVVGLVEIEFGMILE